MTITDNDEPISSAGNPTEKSSNLDDLPVERGLPHNGTASKNKLFYEAMKNPVASDDLAERSPPLTADKLGLRGLSDNKGRNGSLNDAVKEVTYDNFDIGRFPKLKAAIEYVTKPPLNYAFGGLVLVGSIYLSLKTLVEYTGGEKQPLTFSDSKIYSYETRVKGYAESEFGLRERVLGLTQINSFNSYLNPRGVFTGNRYSIENYMNRDWFKNDVIVNISLYDLRTHAELPYDYVKYSTETQSSYRSTDVTIDTILIESTAGLVANIIRDYDDTFILTKGPALNGVTLDPKVIVKEMTDRANHMNEFVLLQNSYDFALAGGDEAKIKSASDALRTYKQDSVLDLGVINK